MPPTTRSAPTPIFICFFLIVSDVTSLLNALQTSLHYKLVCALSYMVSLMYMNFDAPNTSFVAHTQVADAGVSHGFRITGNCQSLNVIESELCRHDEVFTAMDAACFCDRELREEAIDSSGEKRRTRSRFHGAGQPPLSNSRNFLMASALFFSDATSNRIRA